MMLESGLLCLSSDRTLNDFKSCRPFVAGIDYDLITQHASTYANTDYTLMLDEMKIKQGLVTSHACFLGWVYKEQNVCHVAATFFTKSASSARCLRAKMGYMTTPMKTVFFNEYYRVHLQK